MKLPQISVIVPTRDRADHAVECARAILACVGPRFELLVVDQSANTATRDALSAFRDPRLRYVQSRARGASAGRNTGLLLARGSLVAMTDDDCRPPVEWLEQIVRFFDDAPAVDLVCGRVEVRDRDGWGSFGLTANMAVRATAVARLGSFDEALSPGTDLKAGEDVDWVVRAARCGLEVQHASAIRVVHVGGHQGPELRSLELAHQFAKGACWFKHLRAGDPHVRRLFVEEITRGTGAALGAAARRRKPLGFDGLLGFLRGAASTYRYGVDTESKLFVHWLTRQPVHPLRQ